MAVLVAEAGHLNAREISCAAGFRVEFARDWKQVAARWSDISSSTPFQDHRWLDAWYAAFVNFADVEPLIAIISDAATSEQAALLPLVRRVQNGVRIGGRLSMPFDFATGGAGPGPSRRSCRVSAMGLSEGEELVSASNLVL